MADGDTDGGLADGCPAGGVLGGANVRPGVPRVAGVGEWLRGGCDDASVPWEWAGAAAAPALGGVLVDPPPSVNTAAAAATARQAVIDAAASNRRDRRLGFPAAWPGRAMASR